MSRFLKFDPFIGHVPNDPFKRLPSIAWTARQQLEGLDRADVIRLEGVVQSLIAEQCALYAEQELDGYVARLMRDGGWELGYLEHPEGAGEGEIRELLENWPSEAHDRPRISYEDDLSDVDALGIAIEENLLGGEDPVSCAAVLSLMLVADALSHPKCDGITASSRYGVTRTADAAIEAAQAAGLASLLRAETRIKSMLDEAHQEQLREKITNFSKDRARTAAQKRHSNFLAAKRFVQDEWKTSGAEYNFNKSDFARTYVNLIRQRFQDSSGDPLLVTERTIREGWLSGAQNSQPASR